MLASSLDEGRRPEAFFRWSGVRRPRAPASQSGPRGAPGGTVGTTTGCPVGLEPGAQAGEKVRSIRRETKKIAAAGARTSATKRTTRRGTHRAPATPSHLARGEDGRKAGQGSKDVNDPERSARGNAGPCPGRSAARSDALQNRDRHARWTPDLRAAPMLPGRFAPRRLSRCSASGEHAAGTRARR